MYLRLYLPLVLEFNECEEMGIVCFRNSIYFCSPEVYQWNLIVAEGGTYTLSDSAKEFCSIHCILRYSRVMGTEINI
jgi:hypothetical protein